VSKKNHIAFYHLSKWSLEFGIAKILERALSQNLKMVVRAASDEHLTVLNTALWTYDQGSFLPHGSTKEKNPEQQPIYLTTGLEVPNKATVLILTENIDAEDISHFERCIDIFEEDRTAILRARDRWASRKTEGYSPTYWQQDGNGKWGENCSPFD